MALEIPPATLSPAALRGIVEEYVLREGTDYGPTEYSLADKISQVMRQIEQGQAAIVFDPETESCTVLLKQRYPIRK